MTPTHHPSDIEGRCHHTSTGKTYLHNVPSSSVNNSSCCPGQQKQTSITNRFNILSDRFLISIIIWDAVTLRNIAKTHLKALQQVYAERGPELGRRNQLVVQVLHNTREITIIGQKCDGELWTMTSDAQRTNLYSVSSNDFCLRKAFQRIPDTTATTTTTTTTTTMTKNDSPPPHHHSPN